jgi:hypothetical protein
LKKEEEENKKNNEEDKSKKIEEKKEKTTPKIDEKKLTTKIDEKKTSPKTIPKKIESKSGGTSFGDEFINNSSPTKKKIIPIEKFINDSIQNIFKICFTKKGDYFYLETMEKFLNEEKNLDKNMIEICLVERLRSGFTNSKETPLLYLAGCYRRATEIKDKEELKKEVDKQKIEVIINTRKLITFYFGLILSSTDGDYFPDNDEELGPKRFLNFLLSKSNNLDENEYSIPPSFLTDFIESFKDNDDILKVIFNPIFAEMSTRMNTKTLLTDYHPIIQLMLAFSSYAQLKKIFINHPSFIPNSKKGIDLEQTSLLGPYFTITTYFEKPEVADFFFEKVRTLTVDELQDQKTIMRNSICNYQDILYKIMNNLLKSTEDREKVVNWISYVK